TDAGDAGGVHFLVMDFVEGIDASKLVQKHGPLPIADACAIIRQAALGLQFAHEAGNELSALVAPAVNGRFTPNDYYGDFGILVSKGTAVFTNAHIQVLGKDYGTSAVVPADRFTCTNNPSATPAVTSL